MSEEAAPKKKERAPPPPTPPSIATASVLVRYALSCLLAAAPNNGDEQQQQQQQHYLECTPFQATYMKDKPRLTGRVGLIAGKAVASGTPLIDDKATALQHVTEEVFWTALQTVLARLLSADSGITISVVQNDDDTVTKQALFELYGEAVASTALLEESHVGKKSKTKPTDPLLMAVVKNANGEVVFCCFVPSIPYASPSATLQEIVLETTTVSKNKKGLLFSVKWEAVLLKDGVSSEQQKGDAPVMEAMPPTLPIITVPPEGTPLVEQARQQMEEAEKKAAQQAAAQKSQQQQQEQKEMKVNPFEVEGKIDYDRLVKQFGSTLLDDDLMQRFQALTVGKGRVPHLHRFLRRGIFFSHRDLHNVVSSLERNEAPLYLYTGRGPSSSAMHLGHLVPFLFTQWLQQAFDCPLVIQMTDDEKFLFKGEYDEAAGGDNLDHFANLTLENARDIIACGFDYEKTFLFSDLDYVGRMYPNICRIWKAVTTNTVNNMFGFDGSCNMGKIAFPAIQAAPSFASSFPTVLNVPPEQRRETKQICLIPCAIDQDPYFRMTRDVAHKLVDKSIHPLGGKPALIHSKFFPPLQGAQGKMSSSNTNSAIFLTDTPDEIAHKIRAYCFSGGRETKAEQEKYGADIEVDVAYQWLRFFLEDDDELEAIGKDYSTGSGEYWATGKVKERLIVVLQELVAKHQERRAKITDEEVRKWMQERCILPTAS